MADFRKQVVEKVAEIKNIVSDDAECVKVMACVADIVDAFSNQLLEVSRRQVELEERTEAIFEVLSNIEEEMFQYMDEDLVAECPYCGEEIEYEFTEDGEDFRCPKCNNVIELEEILNSNCGFECCDDCCECENRCVANCESEGCEDRCNSRAGCDCGPDCDCGCQDGLECTCDGDCHHKQK